MKKVFTFLTLVLLVQTIVAQTANAVIFSENGEKFTAYLNGEPQNDVPKTNVKITGLTGEFYQLRVDFADAKYTDFSSNQFAVAAGTETTYILKINKKGEYVARFQGQVPISGASTASTGTSDSATKNYAVADDAPVMEAEPATTNQKVTTQATTGAAGVGATQSVTTTTTTTTANAGVPAENVSMNMNVDGMNVGVSMNMSGMNTGMNTEVKESTTVTTTTSSSTSGTAVKPAPKEEVVYTAHETTPCARSMNSTDFTNAKNSISSKGFDDTRLTVAKQVVKSNCMTAAQIKEVVEIFGFEETKLDFAKYAYDYCYDQNNYYVINDSFGFSSTVDELNEYIGSK